VISADNEVKQMWLPFL